MSKTIRVPKQKRAIEKKQKIVMASYQLFSDKGYYKTNTAEIAKAAGISTGIVYSYYKDKKHILLDVIKYYISLLSEQFQPLLEFHINKENLPALIKQFIDISVGSHTMSTQAHNEFLALSLLENEIYTLFDDFENMMIIKLHDLLVQAGLSQHDLLEKVKMSYGIVEQVSHYYIQKKMNEEELNIMNSLAISTIVDILKNTTT